MPPRKLYQRRWQKVLLVGVDAGLKSANASSVGMTHHAANPVNSLDGQAIIDENTEQITLIHEAHNRVLRHKSGKTAGLQAEGGTPGAIAVVIGAAAAVVKVTILRSG